MDTQAALTAAQEQHRSGDLNGAEARYRELVTAHPSNADAHYGLGTVYLQMDRLRDARLHLERAVSAMPAVAEFQFNLGLCLEKSGDRPAACAAYSRAASLAVDDPDLLAPVCRKLLDAGMSQPVAAAAAACSAPTVGILALGARAQAALGNWAGAVASLRALTDRQRNDASAWRELATAAGKLRDYDGAINAYRTYLSLKKPDGDDYLRYADLLLMARDPARARIAVEEAMELGESNAWAHWILARCARLAGNYDEARTELEKAIQHKPAFGSAWLLLLESEPEAGLPAFAHRCLELAQDATATETDAVLLQLTGGQALQRLGQYPDAMKAFDAGNARHLEILAKRGASYDPAETEATYERIKHLFSSATPRSALRQDGPQPIFIVGMPRSGTTLVERILGGLDGVVGGGENEAMEFIASQFYWDIEQAGWPDPATLANAAWDEMAARYWQRSGTQPCVLTDKMMHNFRQVGLIQHIFPGAPVVWMRRDPRDVCVSIYARMFPDGHRYACDFESMAHHYAQCEALMRHWQAVYPSAVLPLVYEELVADPEHQTRRLAEFCGLAWHRRCLEFHERTHSSFTFSEMQVREPLNSAGIGRWRRYGDLLDKLCAALTKTTVLPYDRDEK